jgi:anthranilate phosphoribosyltransferase
LLIALKSKGETVEEMSGFVLAMLDVAERVDPGYTVLDTCGTGGDGLRTINISTIAAFIAAGAGAKVCKHGGRSASSLTGSADLLEELGVTIDLGAEGVSKCIDEVGMGFCFAPVFHPAMRYAAPVRRELGIPTVFNLLGPLANPALRVRQLVGVPSLDVLQKVGQVLSRKGCERAMIVHGDDGMDELSLCAPSTVLEITDGGEITHFELYPPDYGFKLVSPEAIKGGTARENADIALSILAGEKGHYRDSVVLNASAALMVAGLVDSFEDGIELAIGVLDNGDAQRVLDRLVDLSTRLASA